jgi:metabolite-proton symporter
MGHSATPEWESSASGITAASVSSAYRRLVLASCFGTAIEWYDFFIYGFLAPLVFDVLFFPKLDSYAGTLAVFATFAVGFLARPLGGIVFGHFGDRIGRKSTLLVTLLVMGVGTAAIGLLPTYRAIGIWAPIFLVALRFIQGFALGGESIGALLLTAEGSPSGRRGLFAALIQASGPIAIIAASFAVTWVSRLPQADLLLWGWRIPFLVSLVLVFIGIYVRLRVEESATFAAATAQHGIVRLPLLEVLGRFPKPTLITFFICLAETSFFYLAAVFSLSYGTKALGLPKAVLTQAVLIANCVALFAMPLFGMLSDRIGRRPMFQGGLLATALYIYPFFLLMGTRDPILVTCAIVIAVGIIHPMMFGPEGSFFAELFETRVRFSGVSFGKQLGTVLGGGLVPLIATALLAWSNGSTRTIVLYYLMLSMLAFIAASAAQETRNRKL